MIISPLQSPVSASWYRSCELTSLRYESASVVLELLDEAGSDWRLVLTNVQAVKVTTEECAVDIIEKLPEGGGVFIADESDWIDSLGKGQVHFLDKSRHFIVPCYDEVVEVVAWDLHVEARPATTSKAT